MRSSPSIVEALLLERRVEEEEEVVVGPEVDVLSSASEGGVSFTPIRHPDYQWLHREVGAYYSKYACKSMLLNFISSVSLSTVEKDKDLPFTLRSCRQSTHSSPDWVFLGRGEEKFDFFYMYDRVMLELHVTIPFDNFTMSVLRILNVAPTQLHPNGWGAIQAFKMLCLRYGIMPTARLFLYHFFTRPSKPVRWVSLIRRPDIVLFKPFKSSFKRFKVGFFKVRIDDNLGRNYFYDSSFQPLFPFYWQKNPCKYDTYSKSYLSDKERCDLEFLESLPRPIPARCIIDLYVSSKPRVELEDTILSVMVEKKIANNFKFKNLRKKMSAEGDAMVARNLAATNNPSPRPPPKDVLVGVEGVKIKKNKQVLDCSRSQRERPWSTDHEERPPLKKLKRQSEVGSFGAGEGFFGEGFDPNTVRDLLLKGPPAAAWAEFYDSQARAFAIAHVLASNSVLEISKLTQELEEGRQHLSETLSVSNELSRVVDNLKLSNVKLEEQLKKLAWEKAQVEEVAEQSAAEIERLQSLVTSLKKEVTDLKGEIAEVTSYAEQNVYSSYTEGFDHAVRQAGLFFGETSKFNLDFDVYQGQLVRLDNIPEDDTQIVLASGDDPNKVVEVDGEQGHCG